MEQGAGRAAAECGGRGMRGPGKLAVSAPTSVWPDPLGGQKGMSTFGGSGMGRGSEGGTVHCPGTTRP